MNNRLFKVMAGSLLLVFGTWALDKSGTISSNETWSGEINITGTVTITSGVVTVQPGTIIKHPSTTAHLVIRRDGGMKAIGTQANPITITTGQASPKKGQWDNIEIKNLTNSANTVFKYCNFEYGTTGIDIRNESGRSEQSAPTFEYCNFDHFTMTCIYVTSGGEPVIRYCKFRDCGSGIYLHGGDVVNISYCEVSVASAGIINVGMYPAWYQTCTIDHCTVYDLKNIRTDYPMPHTGFCYYCGTDQGKLTVTNSICQYIQHSGMIISPGWTLVHDYNCFWQLVQEEVYAGSMGPHSLIADALFADAPNGDFRLQTGSPCIGKASDGKNIGSSQETVATGIKDRPAYRPAGTTVMMEPNPFNSSTTIRLAADEGRICRATVCDISGNPVKVLDLIEPAKRMAVWDGTDQSGRRSQAGIYLVKLDTGNGYLEKKVIYTP